MKVFLAVIIRMILKLCTNTQGGTDHSGTIQSYIPSDREGEEGYLELVLDDAAGIVKAYEAVTQYCGFVIEAGKTMGLFSYGKKNDNIPSYILMVVKVDGDSLTEMLLSPTINAALVNESRFDFLETTNDSAPQPAVTTGLN